MASLNTTTNSTNLLDFYNEYEIRLLHHNVQSLNNKLLDIAVMLAAENLNMNILCFTEHWLLEVQMNVTHIDHFRLASNFSRNHSTSGGSCIFMRNNTETKEAEYLKGLGKEKGFEISVVEVSDIGTILACIYRSPHSDFYEFLHKLELLIYKVSSKGKRLILCGDLNVNFLQYSGKLLHLQNLLLMNNLINIVKSPTRISNHSTSLNDVVNNIKNEIFTVNMDLGYSDHLAQLLLYLYAKDTLRRTVLKNFSICFKKKNGLRYWHLMNLILLSTFSWTQLATILT
jgi:hypothetical protein